MKLMDIATPQELIDAMRSPKASAKEKKAVMKELEPYTEVFRANLDMATGYPLLAFLACIVKVLREKEEKKEKEKVEKKRKVVVN